MDWQGKNKISSASNIWEMIISETKRKSMLGNVMRKLYIIIYLEKWDEKYK